MVGRVRLRAAVAALYVLGERVTCLLVATGSDQQHFVAMKRKRSSNWFDRCAFI